jgi:thiol:disulfide interchange protein
VPSFRRHAVLVFNTFTAMKRRLLLALCTAACAGLFFHSTSIAGDFPKGSPKFETKYKSALAEAKKSGKPLLVVFSATWCGPCQANKKNVYPSEAVQPYHDKFVWVYLDVDEAANKKVAEEFGVNGIPHIQFLDKSGKSLDKLVGGSKPEAFAKKLEEITEKAGPATPAPGSGGSNLAPRKPATEPEKKP